MVPLRDATRRAGDAQEGQAGGREGAGRDGGAGMGVGGGPTSGSSLHSSQQSSPLKVTHHHVILNSLRRAQNVHTDFRVTLSNLGGVDGGGGMGGWG